MLSLVVGSSRISTLIAADGLTAVFQPIAKLDDATILAYEGLIRGPAGSSLEAPHALFKLATEEDRVVDLEFAAARQCIKAFMALERTERLFLNFSAAAMLQLRHSPASPLQCPALCGLPLERIVLELTEQAPANDLPALARAIADLRATGIQIALDDYGTANASMNLWVQLQPDIVKVDRFFIQDIANDPLKFGAVQAMLQFAKASGARLVAEGIENAADLTVVRDMGIELGQGFLLGRPVPRPQPLLHMTAKRALLTEYLAIFPESTHSKKHGESAYAAVDKMLIKAPALTPATTSNEVFELFNRSPERHTLALVEDGIPVGIVNRRSFMDRYAMPYRRELFGKRSCVPFANADPLLIERSTSIAQLASLLANVEQQYLADGFVITENGRYLGIGTGESLVRAVTEIRVEAARYANPLTFLPGNLPISSHIDRLLERAAPFHACYIDLNDFKPFNDHYGYWQGDEVLKLTAQVLTEVCEPSRDFLGHVGGDDFIILFQSEDWEARCRRAIDAFNRGVLRFYAPTDRVDGGIHGVSRRGEQTFYGFVTMAIGALAVLPLHSRKQSSEMIASDAAVAKCRAKLEKSGFFLLKPAEAETAMHA